VTDNKPHGGQTDPQVFLKLADQPRYGLLSFSVEITNQRKVHRICKHHNRPILVEPEFVLPTTTPTFIRTSGNDLVNVVEESPVARAVTVHITETEFAFIPEIRVFHPGVHYYFIVHNNGKQTHAFTFVPTNPDGTPLSDIYYQYNHTLINLDTIPPGTTQTINYTFKTSDIGHFELACRMRGHYLAGMHLPVVVE
jgi:uncharacterized cupredoxin-like copper-binding protein